MSESNLTEKCEKNDSIIKEDAGLFINSESDLTSRAKDNIDRMQQNDNIYDRIKKKFKSIDSIDKNSYEKIIFPARLFKKLVDFLFRGKWKLLTLDYFERFFMLYSRFVFKNPVSFILVTTVICLILGIGHFYRHPVEDSERQFALPKSQAKNDENFYNSAFPGARTRHEIVMFKAMDGGSIITRESLQIMRSFHEGLMNVTFELGEEDAKSLLEAYNELRNSTSSKQRATEETFQANQSMINDEVNHLRSIIESPRNMNKELEEINKRRLFVSQKFGFGSKKKKTNKEIKNESFNNTEKIKIEKHYLDAKMFTSDEYIPPEVYEVKDPKTNNIIKKYKFSFAHVCARLQGGSCRRPSGILWMYKEEKDFGKPIPVPYVINTLTYQSFKTDMWLSPMGMEYDKRSEHVVSSRAAIIEYQLSDQDKMKKYSFLWEEQFMKYCEKVQGKLRDGDYKEYIRDASNFMDFASITAKNTLFEDKANNTYNKNNSKTNSYVNIGVIYDDLEREGVEEYSISDLNVDSKNKDSNEFNNLNIKRISKGATKYLFKGESKDAPLSIYYNARRALSDELTEQTYIHTLKDYTIIGSLVVILLVYGWTVGYGSNIYTSRATSGVCGAIAALLAYIGGAGLCYLAGLEHTSTASAAPFLVLGVGMDDSFVVINSFNMTYPLKNAEDRIVSSIRDCGLSISLTTLTNLLSFAIGTSAGYLAIRNFCILTFVGLLFGYVTCLTILLGVLCIDARLEEKKILKVFGKELFTNYKYPDPLVPEIKVPIEKFSTVALIGYLTSQYKMEKSSGEKNCIDELKYTEEIKNIQEEVRNEYKNNMKLKRNNMEDASINSPIDEEEIIENGSIIDRNNSKNDDQTQRTTYFNYSSSSSSFFSHKNSNLSNNKISDISALNGPRKPSYPNIDNGYPYINNEDISKKVSKNKKESEDNEKDDICNSNYLSDCNRSSDKLMKSGSNVNKIIPNFSELIDARLINYKRGRSNAHSSIQLMENIEISDYNTELMKKGKKLSDIYSSSNLNENLDSSLINSEINSNEDLTSRNDYEIETIVTSVKSVSGKSLCSDNSSELSVFPMEIKQNIGRKSRRFVIKYYATFLTLASTRIIIMLLTAIFLGVSIYSSVKLKMGLDLKVLAPPSSQVYKFYLNHEQLFNKYGDVTYLMFQASQKVEDGQNNVWWEDEFMERYKELQNQVHNAWFTEIKLDGMLAFYDSILIKGLPKTPIEYSKMLKAFISSPFNRHYEDDFVFNSDTGELEAWRSVLIPVYLPDTSIRGKYMTDVRKIMESIKEVKNPIAYSPLFIFYESDVSILPQTLYNMGCALIAVLLASLILMPSVSSVIIVIVILCMVDVCIIGMMAQWGLHLNMLTMVNLIMSIGISVDYSTHICHCFAHCSGNDRNTRVIETLGLMGIPIFHGAMSTQFAVTVLAFSDSYVLQTFYKMMTLVVCIGICYGAIILPVILTIFGPMDVVKYTKAHHKQ
ncbi:hypothetical protein FG386_000571 [Cryptosporidium ryanae]|uniref:uncharacterized protein n=1 Tax=Cryptosporidium ryanae TaxID=515981 RepID=UPI00351A963E|nr:hypothetical protein FG386_000571 [Cryptosporidium ryanae]